MKRILLIDNSSPTHETIQKHLKFRNCLLDVTRTREEALALSRDRQYDLVIMDASPPANKRTELFKALRIRCPEAAFIIYTEYQEPAPKNPPTTITPSAGSGWLEFIDEAYKREPRSYWH